MRPRRAHRAMPGAFLGAAWRIAPLTGSLGPTADVTRAIGPQLRGPIIRDVRGRYQALATYLLGYSFGKDRLAALRLQVPVGKAQNLKTSGITDDPEIQLVSFSV